MSGRLGRTIRRLERRLLFVRAPVEPSNRIACTADQFVVTALLKRSQNAPALTDALLNRVGDALFVRKTQWNLASVRVLRSVPLSRPVVFLLELVRTHTVAAWLCRLDEKPTPEPPYSLALAPLYDAVVELQFTQPPASPTVQDMRKFLEKIGPFVPPTLLGSRLQVQVFGSPSASDDMHRVNICFPVKRPTLISREQCQEYWKEQHARLVVNNMSYLRLTAYRQVHTMAEPLASLDDTNIYDGVACAEKLSFSQLLWDLLKIDTIRFNDTLVVDECQFTHATPILLMQLLQRW